MRLRRSLTSAAMSASSSVVAASLIRRAFSCSRRPQLGLHPGDVGRRGRHVLLQLAPHLLDEAVQHCRGEHPPLEVGGQRLLHLGLGLREGHRAHALAAPAVGAAAVRRGEALLGQVGVHHSDRVAAPAAADPGQGVPGRRTGRLPVPAALLHLGLDRVPGDVVHDPPLALAPSDGAPVDVDPAVPLAQEDLPDAAGGPAARPAPPGLGSRDARLVQQGRDGLEAAPVEVEAEDALDDCRLVGLDLKARPAAPPASQVDRGVGVDKPLEAIPVASAAAGEALLHAVADGLLGAASDLLQLVLTAEPLQVCHRLLGRGPTLGLGVLGVVPDARRAPG